MQLQLREVKTECQKKDCGHQDAVLHRHHMKSQKLFVHCFRQLYRTNKYKRFKENYWKFRRKDICTLCEWHHLEIHAIYRPIISAHKWKNKRKLRDFTWLQAERLMQDLELACKEWLKKPSPGLRPLRR